MITAKPYEANSNYGGFFKDVTVELSGTSWLNFTFLNCVLVLDSYDEKTTIFGAYINECRLIGDGWPKWSKRLIKGSDGAWVYP